MSQDAMPTDEDRTRKLLSVSPQRLSSYVLDASRSKHGAMAS